MNFKTWLFEYEGFTFPGTSAQFVNDPSSGCKSRYHGEEEPQEKVHIANFGFKKEDSPLMKRQSKKMKKQA